MTLSEAQRFVMPYGKYKGWELRKVPYDYLMYVEREHDLNRYPLFEVALARLIQGE